MNSSSNSAQHSALLATGQVYRDRDFSVAIESLSRAVCDVAHAVRAIGSIPCVAPPLVCALMRVLSPVVRTPSVVLREQAWSVGCDRKLYVVTPPLQTLLQHKIFCRDRNSLALGKLCCDTKGPLS